MALTRLEKVGAVAGIVSSLAFVYYLFGPQRAGPSIGALDVSLSSSSTQPGSPVTFSGTAYDQSGGVLPSVNGQVLSDGVPVGAFTTGRAGTFSVVVAFESQGTYSLTASAGDVTSDPVSVTVS